MAFSPFAAGYRQRIQERTFLFGDVEGSTGLLRELDDHYDELLFELRSLLRAEIEKARGRVVGLRGDEVFAVFLQADAAVRAAVAIQRSLAAGQVHLRIGLHTGIARRDTLGDYSGIEVHRASRIADAGHGGQVLLSEATARRAHAQTRDLGEYELPGLDEPERILQLVHAGLRFEFPPLRTDVPLRVALAGGGLRRQLEESGIRVVSEVDTLDGLLRDIGERRPDVVVVDMGMTAQDLDENLEAARIVREAFPDVRVLLLSEALGPVRAAELIASSPTGIGYLLKNRSEEPDEFMAALHRAIQALASQRA